MNYFTIPGLANVVYPVIGNVFYQSIAKKQTEVKYCISPYAIMAAVCDAYRIPMEQLKKVTNKRTSVEPRQVAFYLLKHKTLLSLNGIGDLFNGKDHATVLHGLHACQNAIDTGSVMGNIATKLMQEL